jgi:hypothetical protein
MRCTKILESKFRGKNILFTFEAEVHKYVLPPVNAGLSVALKVLLSYIWTLRHRGILYSIFKEKNVSFGLENAV